MGKTLINVFDCYSAEIRFVGKLTSLNADIFINQRIECLNNTTNLRPLTTHITPCYTHKMTIISVTSSHPMYTPADRRQACTAIQAVSRLCCSWRCTTMQLTQSCLHPASHQGIQTEPQITLLYCLQPKDSCKINSWVDVKGFQLLRCAQKFDEQLCATSCPRGICFLWPTCVLSDTKAGIISRRPNVLQWFRMRSRNLRYYYY